jgi:hypothetical protein
MRGEVPSELDLGARIETTDDTIWIATENPAGLRDPRLGWLAYALKWLTKDKGTPA